MDSDISDGGGTMGEGEDSLRQMLDDILSSPKYRHFELPEETLRQLILQQLPLHHSDKEILKAVRKKLHNIVAPYLGDPDYRQARSLLDEAFTQDDADSERAACKQILSAHASTSERMHLLDTFYERLFRITGPPRTILDLACGLNPFSFPWMGLPLTTRYYAFDIHRPRIQLINHYFGLKGLAPLGMHQDVLVDPPQVAGEVAFLFKEAHRFEQRQRGCNLPQWQALRVRYILVSLPGQSLSGKHDLVGKQRALMKRILDGTGWSVEEIEFDNELVFCIDKGI
jgi:16S rRNA (guanine(1405)-N(7))-methyltransferase